MSYSSKYGKEQESNIQNLKNTDAYFKAKMVKYKKKLKQISEMNRLKQMQNPKCEPLQIKSDCKIISTNEHLHSDSEFTTSDSQSIVSGHRKIINQKYGPSKNVCKVIPDGDYLYSGSDSTLTSECIATVCSSKNQSVQCNGVQIAGPDVYLHSTIQPDSNIESISDEQWHRIKKIFSSSECSKTISSEAKLNEKLNIIEKPNVSGECDLQQNDYDPNNIEIII
jgi:hypothetical protein